MRELSPRIRGSSLLVVNEGDTFEASQDTPTHGDLHQEGW